MNTHETIWASLDEIRIGERTVARLSTATIELYRAWLEQGREAPPVRLARQGDEFVVRDGRHRVAAALAAGHRFIEAEVRPIARLLRRLSAIARSPSGGSPSLGARGRGSSGRTPRLHRGGVGSTPTVSMQFTPP